VKRKENDSGWVISVMKSKQIREIICVIRNFGTRKKRETPLRLQQSYRAVTYKKLGVGSKGARCKMRQDKFDL
jgi:hypothetical protein